MYWSDTLEEILCASQSEVHFCKNLYRFFQANSNFEGSVSWKGKYSEEIGF